MNYIEHTEKALDDILGMSGTDYSDLLGVYAILVLVVGVNCTNKNIHDAWSVWQTRSDSKHRSLIPFSKLTKEVQELDSEYRDAVIMVAKVTNRDKLL